jgi:rhodanese-related sulfurtransferase
MSEITGTEYAGDVSAKAAFEGLGQSPDATLIDVRTAAEWVYVGVPVLAPLGKATLLVSWDSFPGGEVIPDFPGRLVAALEERGIGRKAPLYFICRSGARSRRAAIAATAAGYGPCFNVMAGFEGPLDADKHRATPGSWKAAGLPWVQS